MAHDILIVDDESDIRSLTAGILEDEGYETREAADSQSALDALAARRPNLVLLDIWLQGSELDGLQILKKIKENHPEIPVLMMSGTERSRPPSRRSRTGPTTSSKNLSNPTVCC